MTVIVQEPETRYGRLGMTATRRGITENQRREMRRLLAAGHTREEISTELGVSRSSVYKELPAGRPELPPDLIDVILGQVDTGRETIRQVEDLLEQATLAMANTANLMRQVGAALGRNDERWLRLADLAESLRNGPRGDDGK